MLFAQYANVEEDKKSARRELRCLKAAWQLSVGELPQGTGVPALFVPGYMADDRTTRIARELMTAQGHQAFATEMDGVMDFTDQHLALLITRLSDIHAEAGHKVNLIGHSAGGIIARHVARLHPDKVGNVITLGSDFNLLATSSVGGVETTTIFDFVGARVHGDHIAGYREAQSQPPPTPTTSIFTEGDDFVPRDLAQSYIKSSIAENVNLFWTNESLINGAETGIWAAPSHMGMLLSVQALTCIADRLATDSAQWQPFKPEKYTVFSSGAMSAHGAPQRNIALA